MKQLLITYTSHLVLFVTEILVAAVVEAVPSLIKHLQNPVWRVLQFFHHYY